MPGVTGVSQTFSPLAADQARPNSGQVTSSSFVQMLGDSIRALDSAIKQSQGSVLSFLTGEEVDVHSVVIAQEKAALALQFAVEVRNKVIEAYQEFMRMQV
ncbi:MAG: flagellar hook-basal body complex protein FliE [Bacillota bacterium]